MANQTSDKTLRINTYIAEFNNLRAEQLKRIDSQNQAMSYLFLVIGASASAVVASVDKPSMPVILCWIALFLPVATAPLAFMFFDNEMAIHSIGSHIYWHLRDKNLTELVGDEKILEPSLEFLLLHRSSRKIHRTLSRTRWSLFLLPTLVPVIGVAVSAVANWGWWWRYLPEQMPVNPWIVFSFGLLLWAVGLGALCLEAVAVTWTFIKHDRFSDTVPRGLHHLIRPKIWPKKSSEGNEERETRPLDCSFTPEASPSEGGAGCSVKFADERLVLERRPPDGGQKGEGHERPEQTLEIHVDDIEFIGIKPPPRARRGWGRPGGRKPRELFIELKGDSTTKAWAEFKRVRDCRGRRCSLYFEKKDLGLAKALKEKYRRLASGYDE